MATVKECLQFGRQPNCRVGNSQQVPLSDIRSDIRAIEVSIPRIGEAQNLALDGHQIYEDTVDKPAAYRRIWWLCVASRAQSHFHIVEMTPRCDIYHHVYIEGYAWSWGRRIGQKQGHHCASDVRQIDNVYVP